MLKPALRSWQQGEGEVRTVNSRFVDDLGLIALLNLLSAVQELFHFLWRLRLNLDVPDSRAYLTTVFGMQPNPDRGY